MSIPVVVADKNIPYLEYLPEQLVRVVSLSGQEITREALMECEAIGLLTRTRTRVNKHLLEGTSVRWVGTTTIGTDHIDLDYCKQKGIRVVSAPGCNAGGVMQYVGSAIAFYLKSQHLEASKLTLGIVGYGHTGKKTARIGRALGMNILINDPPLANMGELPSSTPLEDLLIQSDIISLHVPLTFTGKYPTHYLLNRQNLTLLKHSACIINTSRGGVLKEKDFIHHKKLNDSLTLILDVFENEPDISFEILNYCTLATPHIAGYSIDGKRNASSIIFNELLKFLGRGEVLKLPDIPPPEHPLIEANNILEALLKVYPIQNESEALKASPPRFEEFRSNYKYRHESHHFTIKTFHAETKKAAEYLGFRLNPEIQSLSKDEQQ